MMFSYFLCLFLTVLSSAVAGDNCPPSGRLNEKIANLTVALHNINSSLFSVIDLVDAQCPCVDGSASCFQSRVENFSTNLDDLIDDVHHVTTSAPTECPDRTGAVFVATCDGTAVGVVDPNGIIQNGFNLDTNVTGWVVFINDGTYGIVYFRNDPFEVRCRPSPDGVEVQLGNASIAPLNPTAIGTGIFIDPATGLFYASITFSDPTLNGIFCFNKTTPGIITMLFSYDGVLGVFQINGDFVYITDGGMILRRLLDGSDDWTLLLFFSATISTIDVLDNGQILFTDGAGALYIFLGDETFRQLRRPEPSNGPSAASSVISPCDSLLYVVNIDDRELGIFNSTSFERVGSLNYTESTPSPCPTIGIDPTFCCA